jgi:CBS domain-containing protein
MIIIEEAVGFLKGIPPFQFLNETALTAVAGKLSMDFYPKDTIILKQDGAPSEYLRIIKKGGVKVYMEAGDEEVVIDYRGEGDNFGFLSLIGKDKVRANVKAIDDTICYLIDKNTALKLLSENSDFTEYFLKSHLTKYIDNTYREMHNKSLFYGGSDRLLFTTQVGDIAAKNVIIAKENMSIQEAAQIMAEHKISSLIIADTADLPVGIVTDRDLREKVVAKGRDVDEPVKNIMSIPLIRVDAKDYCFEAVLKMIKHGIHHVLVIKDGKLDGVITNHDLMLLQGTSPLSFAKDIENQQSIDGLVPVSRKINKVVSLLLKEGAKASNITKIITELNDRLVKKVLEFAEKKYGKAPVAYCWIIFGSEGRKEQTFRTDQDNAIIYADLSDEFEAKEIEAYFGEFSAFVRDGLLKCGFPQCPADYMASNPNWRQPLSVWKNLFAKWINTPTPEAVLKSLIFFDFRPLHGDLSLASNLREYLNKILQGQNIFFAKMASVITKSKPPLGFFRTFIVEKDGEHKNEINLKFSGIGMLVDIVRFCALESGVSETSTLERIKALKETHPVMREMGDELEQAFEFITLLRIHHQIEQMDNKQEPDNFIIPDILSSLQKKTLKESFQAISKVQDIIIEQYKAGMVGT